MVASHAYAMTFDDQYTDLRSLAQSMEANFHPAVALTLLLLAHSSLAELDKNRSMLKLYLRFLSDSTRDRDHFRESGMSKAIFASAIIVALIGLLLLLNNMFPTALGDDQTRATVFATAGWLVLLVGSIALRFRSQPGSALRAMAGCLLVVLVLIWGYAYRFEAQDIGNRMLSVLLPPQGVVSAPNQQTASNASGAVSEIRFALNQYGHYQVDARVNGTYITFLVDTGASDVVLSPDDAHRIGLDGQLNFSDHVETANGTAYVAPITLNELTIGPIVMHRLPAKVNQAPMQYSLLGMRFLNQLSNWRVQGQTLILDQ